MNTISFTRNNRSSFMLLGAVIVCLLAGFAAFERHASGSLNEAFGIPASGWLAGFVVLTPLAISALSIRAARTGLFPTIERSSPSIRLRSGSRPGKTKGEMAVGFSQSLAEGDDLDIAMSFTSQTHGESLLSIQQG